MPTFSWHFVWLAFCPVGILSAHPPPLDGNQYMQEHILHHLPLKLLQKIDLPFNVLRLVLQVIKADFFLETSFAKIWTQAKEPAGSVNLIKSTWMPRIRSHEDKVPILKNNVSHFKSEGDLDRAGEKGGPGANLRPGQALHLWSHLWRILPMVRFFMIIEHVWCLRKCWRPGLI